MSDYERFKNFIIFKQWATDQEVKDNGIGPYIFILVLALIALGIIKLIN